MFSPFRFESILLKWLLKIGSYTANLKNTLTVALSKASRVIFFKTPSAQKFPTSSPTIIFSISATLHGVNALNMARAKPSGSEKVAVGCENIFGLNDIFFLPQKVWPGLETGCWRHVGVLKLKILLWASMFSKYDPWLMHAGGYF